MNCACHRGPVCPNTIQTPPQTLSFIGTIVTISDGNSIDLSSLINSDVCMSDVFFDPIIPTP